MLKPLIDAILYPDGNSVTDLPKKEKSQDEAHLKFLEMSAYENSFLAIGKRAIAGIDEAGRGPIAGPVVAAAVILPDNFYLPGLNDSKKLTKNKRERLYQSIIETCDYGIGMASVDEIDRINILEATRLAMLRAMEQLSVTPDQLLVDAVTLETNIPQAFIVKGDAKSISIAAASILAKVTRDHYMEKIHQEYPMYGFDHNSGYGTREHLEAIERYGITPEHRKSFEPIRTKILTKTTLFDFIE